MKKFFFIIGSLPSLLNMTAPAYAESAPQPAEGAEKISYIPEFHGAVRPRWEVDTETGPRRFEVRWARFTAEGKVAP